MAKIHAYLSADGYVIKNPPTQRNKYYYIGFRNTCETLLEDFETAFYSYFNVKPRRCKDGRTVVQNKSLYQFLTREFSYYSKEWSMPLLCRDQLMIWLRAFFDCEAWVLCKKGKNRHIGMDLVNHTGLLAIRDKLTVFGIKSKVHRLPNRNTSRLYIYGQSNLLRYQKMIGFLHPKKNIVLQKALDSYVIYKWAIPSGLSKREFVISLLKKRISNLGSRRYSICSNQKGNLLFLQDVLMKEFRIDAKLPIERKNGLGNSYYELGIYSKEAKKKVIQLIEPKSKVCTVLSTELI